MDDFVCLPKDVAVASSLDGKRKITSIATIAAEDMALDIGDATIDEFTSKLTFSLSADDSIGLLSSRRASALPEGVCLYTNGIDSFTLRPHDYRQYE